MSYDAASWGALALALSILGAVITWFRWRTHGLPSLLRGAAWSLLPVAAWLTGVLELIADVAGSVSRWAVHLVFSPVVWLGIVLAGISVVLFAASAALRGRDRQPGAVGAGRARPLRSKVGGKKPGRRDSAGDTGSVEGMEDIDAILRRHGIS